MFPWWDPEVFRECLAKVVRDHLAVREGEVRRGGHRREVALPFLGANRGAAKLPVGQVDAVFRGGAEHPLKEIVADLVAKPPRAGVDHEGHLAHRQTECSRGFFVEDLVHPVHLEEVVARAESPELRPASFHRPFRHEVGVGARDGPPLFDVIEVRCFAAARGDGRAGPFHEDLPQLRGGQAQVPPVCSDASRNVAEEGVDELLHSTAHLFCAQT